MELIYRAIFHHYRIKREQVRRWEEQERMEEKIEVAEMRTKVVSHYIMVPLYSDLSWYLETRYSITS